MLFVLRLVSPEDDVHLLELLLLIHEVVLLVLAHLQAVHVIHIGSQGELWLAQGHLNLLEALDDVFGFLIGQVEQVLLYIGLLIFHSLSQAIS